MSSTVRHADIEAFCREHFNEPVISASMKVDRLIGYGETAVDAYYITHSMMHGVVWNSAVGPCMTLRALKEQDKVIARDGVHDGDEWNNFTRLDEWLALNGAPRAPAFVLELRHDDFEMTRGKLEEAP